MRLSLFLTVLILIFVRELIFNKKLPVMYKPFIYKSNIRSTYNVNSQSSYKTLV